ncbi:hypothetical protein Nepgr_002252 [Nepenthes gracilis]|uniref:Uncharacterized protein n=1 Tax=Nepenthes gracilis TaxID=150966 RepID=A0AAD3P8K0_NEPGR|nr:hypothetical protein Nepgr_002252 [Nepenthes gracilis]
MLDGNLVAIDETTEFSAEFAFWIVSSCIPCKCSCSSPSTQLSEKKLSVSTTISNGKCLQLLSFDCKNYAAKALHGKQLQTFLQWWTDI